METHDSTPIPPSEAADAKPSGSAVPASVAGSPGSGRSGAVRLWALGAGAAAALVSWLLIEATLDSFKPKGTASSSWVRRSCSPGGKSGPPPGPGTRYWPWG